MEHYIQGELCLISNSITFIWQYRIYCVASLGYTGVLAKGGNFVVLLPGPSQGSMA